MFWTFMTALWLVMLVAPIALLVALLPAGRDCPRCGSESLPIRVAALRPVRRFLTRRWCTACGWEGVVRITRQEPAPAVEVVHQAPEEAVDEDAVWRGERDSGGGVL
ncbi:MAG TPA: hypothetical protein VEW03_12135 [Longimicrobiaceae bacterium]|nr:hypothetical protein [Longimicrobiaceae bacterium]